MTASGPGLKQAQQVKSLPCTHSTRPVLPPVDHGPEQGPCGGLSGLDPERPVQNALGSIEMDRTRADCWCDLSARAQDRF